MEGQKYFGYFPPGRAGFSKVTRRKGGTLSSRYRKNGYVHDPKQLLPPKQKRPLSK